MTVCSSAFQNNNNNVLDDYSLWIGEMDDSNIIGMGGKIWEYSVTRCLLLLMKHYIRCYWKED